MRKLQIALPDFRRLCIFKGTIVTTLCYISLIVVGIYPREPRNKKKASKSSTQSTTFYYTKDIQYLLHEPLLQTFRNHKALSKKIARALGRGEVGEAARLEKSGVGKISLDHIIKERYPTFVDALRDLDDALSMLFLFASLPSTVAVPPKTIRLCQRLCLEFEHCIIVSHSLRKSFLSIKGIYYQATIQGQDIMWLVPYKFVQRITNDVDFRIMGTFVEFYTTLLGFVNFRLYTTMGLVYPPKFNKKSDEQGGELGAFTLERKGVVDTEAIEPAQTNGDDQTNESEQAEPDAELQKRVDEITLQATDQIEEVEAPSDEQNHDAIDTFETTGEGADVLPQPQISNSEASSLFAEYTFFLSRETPRQPLEFILRAFGCKRIGWDAVLGDGAFTNNEVDPLITHQVVDRPPVTTTSAPVEAIDTDEAGVPKTGTLPPGYRVPGRAYVQPQWIWDCINEARLLRTDHYAPGAALPPHLSPWVKPKKGEYDPRVPLEEQEREGEGEEFEEEEAEAAAIEAAEAEESEEEDEEAIEANGAVSDDEIDAHGMDIAGSEQSDEKEADGEEFGGFEDEPVPESADEEEVERDQYQAELEAEAAGIPFSNGSANGKPETTKDGKPLRSILKPQKGNEARKKAEKKRMADQEELQRNMGMMSRKKRKLLEKMDYGNRKREEEAEKLRKKRRKLAKSKEAEKAAMAI